MDKKILYTLDLKFKRHNLIFDYDVNAQKLTIGKTKKVIVKYIVGILIILLCFFFAGLINRMDIPMNLFLRIILLLLSGTGFVMIGNAYKLSKNSKYKKVFSPNSIELLSTRESKKYDAENIQDLVYEINKYKDTFNGKMFILLKDNSKIELLTLIEKNRTHLKSDFEYLRGIIKEHVNI
ncbi:hypothetical protein JM658_06460 [Joostella atrarenae]|uniref:YcxB-like protein domain-containing protein n=1 Tax=Joostella atrarenae TaxID=679257 RepID=A0ABS9J221_9FLAO|nr:hypothetical protein [Joostella atrarenae]MCF8714471.1 hypothetical protein [Joostella atrarenae]